MLPARLDTATEADMILIKRGDMVVAAMLVGNNKMVYLTSKTVV